MAKHFFMLCWLCCLCKLAVPVFTTSDPNQAISLGEAFFQVLFLNSEAVNETSNTGTWNEMRGTRRIGGMSSKIPGNIAKHSGERC